MVINHLLSGMIFQVVHHFGVGLWKTCISEASTKHVGANFRGWNREWCGIAAAIWGAPHDLAHESQGLVHHVPSFIRGLGCLALISLVWALAHGTSTWHAMQVWMTSDFPRSWQRTCLHLICSTCLTSMLIWSPPHLFFWEPEPKCPYSGCSLCSTWWIATTTLTTIWICSSSWSCWWCSLRTTVWLLPYHGLLGHSGRRIGGSFVFPHNAWPPQYWLKLCPLFLQQIAALGARVFRTEWAIYATEEDVASSIDLASQLPNQSLILVDWKRAQQLCQKGCGFGRNMAGCLATLPDATLWHYHLQLNIGRFMFQTYYDCKVGYWITDWRVRLVLCPDPTWNHGKCRSNGDIHRQLLLL